VFTSFSFKANKPNVHSATQGVDHVDGVAHMVGQNFNDEFGRHAYHLEYGSVGVHSVSPSKNRGWVKQDSRKAQRLVPRKVRALLLDCFSYANLFSDESADVHDILHQ